MKINAPAKKLAGMSLMTLSSNIGVTLLLFSSPILGARRPTILSPAHEYVSKTNVDRHLRTKRRRASNLSGSFPTGNWDVDETVAMHRRTGRIVAISRDLRGGDASPPVVPCKVSMLIELLDVFGTAVFAFSGALKAGRKGMDIIGMMIIASITSMGGGTLRDILMMGGGEGHVVFWMKTPMYLEISLFTAVLTFYIWPKIEKKFGLEFDSALPICTSDALGLAAFCIVGVEAAATRGLAPTLWVVSGLMTATFGGIMRDVICGEQPRIMYPHRTLYALGPALGALTYTVLDRLSKSESSTLSLKSSGVTLIAFLVAFMVRVLSFNKPWRMPHWNIEQVS